MKVDVHRKDRSLVAWLQGDWQISDGIPRFDELVEEQADSDALNECSFDTTKLGEWDSSLVAFLLEGMRYCDARDISFNKESLPDNAVKLLELAEEVPERDLGKERAKDNVLALLGKKGIAAASGFLSFATFLGEVASSLVRVLVGKERFRWRDFWLAIQSNSIGALPIVTLISFLVGLIIAFLGAVVLVQFGAGYYISYLVGFGMLRQMGALMTGVIITGRTGAAFAAELGSMKIMEELDAFRTLGLSPISYLVLPRVVALTLMMPLLTIYAMFIGILGGLVVAVSMVDLTAAQYFSGLLYPVDLVDGLLGLAKAVVFGAIIGITGCMQGINAGSDAGAVGKAATQAVVIGITLIIVANAAIDWMAAIVGI